MATQICKQNGCETKKKEEGNLWWSRHGNFQFGSKRMLLHSRRPGIKDVCTCPHNTGRYGKKSAPSIYGKLWTANWRHTCWNVWPHYAQLPSQPVRDWCPMWQRLQGPIHKRVCDHLWQKQQNLFNRLERSFELNKNRANCPLYWKSVCDGKG